MKKYKLNDSFTTFVVDEMDMERQDENRCVFKDRKNKGWDIGAKVTHYEWGIGEIVAIDDMTIIVQFNACKSIKLPKHIVGKDILISFEAKKAKNDTLKLCT